MFEGLADSTGVKVILSWPKKLIQVLKVLQLILKRKNDLFTSILVIFCFQKGIYCLDIVLIMFHCASLNLLVVTGTFFYSLFICYFIHISLCFFVLSFMIVQALSGATGLSTKWAEVCEGSRKVF